MKNHYLKIFAIGITLLLNTGVFAQSKINSFVFESTLTNCDSTVPSGGFIDGIECNGAMGQIAANDILVPLDSNLILNAVRANMMVAEGETITSATIWIFEDEWGYPYMYPGYELTSQVVSPTSHTLLNNGNGMDFYEVLWDLAPIALEGRTDYTTRYWVGISAITSDGSTAKWEVTSDHIDGRPAAFSTGSWFDIYNSSLDGSYTFYAECEPIGGGSNDCGTEIASGGFVDGIDCNEANGEIAANDILVPADSDLTLNAIMANMVIEEGETITSATIWIFEDEYGYPYMYPGYEVTSQVVTPTSHTLLNNDAGMDFYEVLWNLTPIVLDGREDFATRYWVGISATTSNGSTAKWEVTSDQMIDRPAAYSTGSWFDIYNSSMDGTYIFFAECEPLQGGGGGDPGDPGEVCDISLATDNNFLGEGINCIFLGHSNTRYAANDITVPSGRDMILTAIKPSLILDAGVAIDGVKVKTYKDNNGLPGEEINDQYVGITSMDLRTTFGTKEVYEVLIDIEPVFLRGYENTDTVYWIGIAVSTSDYSIPYWEVTYENSLGNPSALSTGSNYSSPNPNQDGVYTFLATCFEINVHTGPNEGYCGYSFLDINQDQDTTCFGMVSDGGMFQSFTATETESSGVGIKFTDPSRGMEVTLSLWDGLSNQGGTVLATQTTHTYGEQWVDVFWDDAIGLEIGTEYFIRIEGDSDLSCIRGSENPYSGGQAYSRFNPFPDYDYTFRTYYCNDISCVQMDHGNTGPFENGTLTSKDQDNLLATDITAPVGKNFNLEQLTVYIWVEPGLQITDADIVFYKDNNGSPGDVLATHPNVVPSRVNYVNTQYGFDWYEVDFTIESQFLQGNIDSIATYWVSLNIGTNLGSAYMSLSSSLIMGYESYNSPDNGMTWEKIENWETRYTFTGFCDPIVQNPCELPELDIDQSSGTDCITTVNFGAAQSFTAEVGASAGAGVKFVSPSNARNVTLSLWDNLPNNGGNMLASKTTQTVGANWVDVFWDQVVPLDLGQDYFVVIDGDAGLPCLSGSTSNLYPGGHVYGSDYEPYPDWDLTFRTYGCSVDGPAGNCDEENPNDFTFETGTKASPYSEFRSANDLTVAAAEDFTLNQITASVISFFPMLEADIYYYSDNGGFPGDEIGKQMGVPVSNQKLLGQRQNMDVYEIRLDVDPFVFEGQIGAPTTYWIDIQYTDLGSTTEVYWMITSATTVGNPVALSEFEGAWYYPNPDFDGVYNWVGDCEIKLGVGSNGHTGFTFYPNPTKEELNLRSDAIIDSVAIYNMLGQLVIKHTINAPSSTLDVSGLSTGAYLMKVSIDGNQTTYKVLKN